MPPKEQNSAVGSVDSERKNVTSGNNKKTSEAAMKELRERLAAVKKFAPGHRTKIGPGQSVAIPPVTYLCLIGGAGAGKSTLANTFLHVLEQEEKFDGTPPPMYFDVAETGQHGTKISSAHFVTTAKNLVIMDTMGIDNFSADNTVLLTKLNQTGLRGDVELFSQDIGDCCQYACSCIRDFFRIFPVHGLIFVISARTLMEMTDKGPCEDGIPSLTKFLALLKKGDRKPIVVVTKLAKLRKTRDVLDDQVLAEAKKLSISAVLLDLKDGDGELCDDVGTRIEVLKLLQDALFSADQSYPPKTYWTLIRKAIFMARQANWLIIMLVVALIVSAFYAQYLASLTRGLPPPYKS